MYWKKKEKRSKEIVFRDETGLTDKKRSKCLRNLQGCISLSHCGAHDTIIVTINFKGCECAQIRLYSNFFLCR